MKKMVVKNKINMYLSISMDNSWERRRVVLRLEPIPREAGLRRSSAARFCWVSRNTNVFSNVIKRMYEC